MIPCSKIILNLQFACKKKNSLPKRRHFQKWLYTTLSLFRKESEVTVRIVDEKEIYDLNSTYRRENKTTNILSFPFNERTVEIASPLLGDLVICRNVVEKEARKQRKRPEAHWAHVVIHGTLHLLGYDHVDDSEAEKMESLETRIMNTLKYKDPYSFNTG